MKGVVVNLCKAISERRLLQFTYDGHRRIVIPAAHGLHVSTGNPVLRGYQTDGTSGSRAVPLWDMFLLSKIHGGIVLEGQFDATPAGFRSHDSHISPLCCELQP